MSLFGKLLAILNVLVAIGFVALAVMDWQARHQWTHAVFLHERAIEGLPLDNTERDPDGKISGFVGTLVDITERKRAENLLRQSEHRNRHWNNCGHRQRAEKL